VCVGTSHLQISELKADKRYLLLYEKCRSSILSATKTVLSATAGDRMPFRQIYVHFHWLPREVFLRLALCFAKSHRHVSPVAGAMDTVPPSLHGHTALVAARLTVPRCCNAACAWTARE
jgi:hypothetical protein